MLDFLYAVAFKQLQAIEISLYIYDVYAYINNNKKYLTSSIISDILNEEPRRSMADFQLTLWHACRGSEH